jgi:hypothetical protein
MDDEAGAAARPAAAWGAGWPQPAIPQSAKTKAQANGIPHQIAASFVLSIIALPKDAGNQIQLPVVSSQRSPAAVR